MPEVLVQAEQATGHVFADRGLLLAALTHSSYASEQSAPVPYNERLEFLGDAVLELVVSRRLFMLFPEEQEGVLTRLRASLVNEEATSSYALALGLEDMLLLGKGENLSGGRGRKSILGDAFEAMLGAVYLDGGFEAAESLVLKVLADPVEAMRALGVGENPKGILQEYAVRVYHGQPTYVELEDNGPKGSPRFVYEVQLGELKARGEGSSKKAAESAAARALLERLRGSGQQQGDLNP